MSREYKPNAGSIVGMIGNDEPGAMAAGEDARIGELLDLKNLAVVSRGGRSAAHGEPCAATIEPSLASMSLPK